VLYCHVLYCQRTVKVRYQSTKIMVRTCEYFLNADRDTELFFLLAKISCSRQRCKRANREVCEEALIMC
jgi:hypothetical protein